MFDVTGGTTTTYNTVKHFKITPENGYHITAISYQRGTNSAETSINSIREGNGDYEITAITTDITVTIKCEPITVTFEYQCGGVGSKSKVAAKTDTYKELSDKDILSAPNEIPAGYAFEYWYDASNGEEIKIESGSGLATYFTDHSDKTVTLTAKYGINYKDVFSAVNGSRLDPAVNGSYTWTLKITWANARDDIPDGAKVLACGFFYSNTAENLNEYQTTEKIQKFYDAESVKGTGNGKRISLNEEDTLRAYFMDLKNDNHLYNDPDNSATLKITGLKQESNHAALGWFAIDFGDGDVHYYVTETPIMASAASGSNILAQ